MATKKQAIIGVIMMAVLAATVYYFWQNRQRGERSSLSFDENNDKVEDYQQDRQLDKGYFSTFLPAGWSEIVPPENVVFLAVNTSEEYNDPILERLNFKTYYALTNKSLNLQSEQDFIKNARLELEQLYPLIDLSPTEEKTIGDSQVSFFTGRISEQGTEFSLMLAFFPGPKNDMWTFSFNTGEKNWLNYEGLRNKIISSFNPG